MKYAFVIARVLLGLVFTVFGLNAFLHFFPNPPVPGLAGQFMGALLGSHYYVIAFGAELIGGTLLLSNRYVPLALTLLGPVIVNILSFHMFLDSENMAPAIVVTVLWLVVFSQVRSSFAGLFVAKNAEVEASSHAEALTAATLRKNDVRPTKPGLIEQRLRTFLG